MLTVSSLLLGFGHLRLFGRRRPVGPLLAETFIGDLPFFAFDIAFSHTNELL